MVKPDGPNRNRWFTVLKSMGGSFHGELLVITRPGKMMIEVPGSTLNPLMRKDVVLCKLRGELHVSLYLNQLI
jgi:hypothetical protein